MLLFGVAKKPDIVPALQHKQPTCFSAVAP
jgi:hypothetical protein